MAPKQQGKAGSASKTATNKLKKETITSSSDHKWQFFAVGLTVAVVSTLYYYYHYGYFQHGPVSLDIHPAPPHGNGDASVGDAAIFTVIELPGKGKGAVAARNIKQGEVVLREKPLFVVPRNIDSSPSAFIADQLQRLPPQSRSAFLDLSYVNFPSNLDPKKHPDEVALAIFQTNAVAAGENVGIFPRMARLNHGCSSAFNVVYSWRDEGGFLIVHALKDIAKGQELLTTYTDSKKPRDERRAYLSQQYGFTCTCDVCSLPDDLSKASDERLSKISALYAAFATWGNNKIDGIQAINHARKIWEIEDEEEYWSERGQLASDAAWIAAAHSDAAATRAWARRAIEWYSFEIGPDSRQVTALRRIVDNPEQHQVWGTRTRLEVGGPGDAKH